MWIPWVGDSIHVFLNSWGDSSGQNYDALRFISIVHFLCFLIKSSLVAEFGNFVKAVTVIHM